MAVSERELACLKMPKTRDWDGGTVEAGESPAEPDERAAAGGGLPRPRYARVERAEDVPAADSRAVSLRPECLQKLRTSVKPETVKRQRS